MPIYVYPSTHDIYVQIKLSKHVLVQTKDINHQLEFLQYMSRYVFFVLGHIRNNIICGEQMGMVRTYQTYYNSHKEWRTMREETYTVSLYTMQFNEKLSRISVYLPKIFQ